MRKFLIGLFALIMSLSLLTACTLSTPEIDDPDDSGVVDPGGETPENPGGETPENPGGETPENPGGETPENPGGETPENPGDDDVYKFTAFSSAELEVFSTYIGEAIPFIANDEYTLKGYMSDTDYKYGVRFTALGNTEDEFFAYIDSLSGYSCTSTVVNDDGITWYTYEKDKTTLEIAYVTDGETSETRVIIKSDLSVGLGYTETAFTAEEAALFESFMGSVIPFAPTNEYYVQDYIYDYDTIGYYTLGNTLGDFNEYRASLVDYSFSGKYDDDYGNTWYIYESDTIAIELSYCTYDEGDDAEYMIYAYVYPSPYTDFSGYERDMLTDYFDTVIPFIPCDEFYVEDDMSDEGYVWVFFVIEDSLTFSSYRQLYSDYDFVESYKDEYGSTCYVYTNGEIYVDMSCSYYEDVSSYAIEVYIYFASEDGDDNSPADGVYTDFTADEKELLEGYFGFLPPFMENEGYSVDDYMSAYDYVNFYFIVDDTSALEEYFKLLDGYTFVESYDDADYGTCYVYSRGNAELDISCYYDDYIEAYLIDMLIYLTESEGGDDNLPADGVYTDFTDEEKALLEEYFGLVIPFMENTGYALDDCMDTYGDVNFYFLVDSMSALSEYRKLFTGYTFIEEYVDDYENTCYVYRKGDVEADMCCFWYDDYGSYLIDVYVYYADDDGEDTPGGGNPTDTPPIGAIADFTDAEKALFEDYFGFVIPFIDGSSYFVEDYMSTDGYVCFYAWDATAAEFAEYRKTFSGYTYVESYDEDGITWYVYEREGVYVELAYYYYDDGEVSGDLVDVYVYFADDEEGEISGGGGGSTPATPDDNGVISNDGKGLPEDGGDGVFDVDFTTATNVKDVTDQGYYLGGCPTTGSPAVLVIPVQFSDAMAKDKGYDISKLNAAFNGKTGSTDYFSVYEYYYISSYGKLDLEITVLDTWFTASRESRYYLKATMDYYGQDVMIGDQILMNEALAYLDGIMDLSKFDSDNNGYIDAVVLVNTLDINENVDMQWAYRYWNIYTDSRDELYEYDGVSANDYLWASFAFLYEDENGDFTDKSAVNTYTYIHEFGHILGADDYYDVSYEDTVMDGLDIMDGMRGDHNAFTKFNLGWLTTSRLVTTDTSVTLKLEAFSKNGDTIIIANNWDESLGAYQEYYIVVYYTNDGLNGDGNGYFLRDGIVVYHVNAVLYVEEQDGEVYYDIYNNNSTPGDGYGTEDNLIEFVKTANDTYTYTAGDTLPTTTDDFGDELAYTFTVDEITEDEAVITFKLIA